MHDFFHLYQPDTVLILQCKILQVIIEYYVSFFHQFFCKLFLM